MVKPGRPPGDPEEFRRSAHRLVDGLADYLRRAAAEEMPVLEPLDPDRLRESLSGEFPAAPGLDVVDTLLEMVTRSNHLHHPGYVGHQVAVPVPEAILAEMTSALLNNGMAIYEMGQSQTIMERQVIEFLARRIGFPGEADGVLTHGGSLGNFTALLAARQAKAGHDVWTEGQRGPLGVLVSDQAHYSVARSVQCMGWGADGAVPVPTDDRYRLRPERLASCLNVAREKGRRVLAVVASSCSTATGSFDPLPEIADFCRENDLWLHVDGAHGASLLLGRRGRDRLRGVERADSVLWDLHKMMALPALNTAVVFRDGRRSYEAFAQEASYLFEGGDPRDDWFNVGRRTMECTKRAMGVTAWCMLHGLGTDFFGDHVDGLVDVTQAFAERLTAAEDFEIATSPEANILCFRHLPQGPGGADLDALQPRLRRRVLERGKFYLVQTRLGDAWWLRVTIMNSATTLDDLERLMAEIRAAARDVADLSED